MVSDILTGEKMGLNTAVAELHDPSARLPGACEAEQLQLLPLQASTNLVPHAENNVVLRGPGRPAGAKNKNTKEWREFILGKYQSPLIALAETYTRHCAELAVELGTTRLEAFKIQIAAAKELAPYVHQKMPLAIEAGEGGLINLTINNTAASAQIGSNAEIVAFEVLQEKDEQNQLVNDSDFSLSNVSLSNEIQQTIENKETNLTNQTD